VWEGEGERRVDVPLETYRTAGAQPPVLATDDPPSSACSDGAARSGEKGLIMKAAVYEGPRAIAVRDVPDAKIEHPTDILVKITSTNICGSDLHMYEGRYFVRDRSHAGPRESGAGRRGRLRSHLGQGRRVRVLAVQHRVRFLQAVRAGSDQLLPDDAAGARPCRRGLRFRRGGPVPGRSGRTAAREGDFNALRLGEDAAERQVDYVMLADIFPTGYHATEMAGVKPGDQTVVFGAGPVGLMAAYSAILKGAGRVWVADHHPDRLRLAKEIGAIPIDTNDQDPSEVVKEATLGLGADNGCECVGYQAHDPQGREDAALTMNQLIDTVRFTGALGVVGVFLPEDPGGAEAQGELEAKGKVPCRSISA